MVVTNSRYGRTIDLIKIGQNVHIKDLRKGKWRELLVLSTLIKQRMSVRRKGWEGGWITFWGRAPPRGTSPPAGNTCNKSGQGTGCETMTDGKRPKRGEKRTRMKVDAWNCGILFSLWTWGLSLLTFEWAIKSSSCCRVSVENTKYSRRLSRVMNAFIPKCTEEATWRGGNAVRFVN